MIWFSECCGALFRLHAESANCLGTTESEERDNTLKTK